MTQVWIDAFVEARDMHIDMVESLGIIGISLLLCCFPIGRPLGPSSLFAGWQKARSRSYAMTLGTESLQSQDKLKDRGPSVSHKQDNAGPPVVVVGIMVNLIMLSVHISKCMCGLGR